MQVNKQVTVSTNIPTTAPPAIKKPEKVPSQSIQSYRELMDLQQLSQLEIDRSIRRLFDNEGIRYEKPFHSTLSATISKHSFNYQIVTLQVCFGNFRFQLTVYCEDKQSCSHVFPYNEGRSDTIVFFAPNEQRTAAIKCFSIEKNSSPQEVFGNVLREFCFLKVASGLKVGPKLVQHCGFDIMFYPDCIQFSMQKGLSLSKCQESIDSSSIKSLKRKLKLLHHFHIAHLDIKPLNIIKSLINQQLVFIDFGFSKLMRQEIGFKTKTMFFGSLTFCNKQMGQLFSQPANTSRHIDLYHNDAHCLSKTIKQLDVQNVSHSQINSATEESIDFYEQLCETNMNNFAKRISFKEEQEKMILKHNIYCRAEGLLENVQNRKIMVKNSDQFIKLILEFPYYQDLNQIFNYIVKKTPHQDIAAEFSSSMQIKKQKLFKSTVIVQDDEIFEGQNILLGKLQISKGVSEVSLECFCDQIDFIVKNNLKGKVLSQQEIDKMTRPDYLAAVVRVIDLRSCRSSFEEKRNIWSLLQLQHIGHFSISTKINFPQVENCFKTILQYFLTNPEEHFEEVIPSVLINLVILRAIQAEQIVMYIQRIKRLDQNPLKMVIMFFRIFFIKYWLLTQITVVQDECFNEISKSIISYLNSLHNNGSSNQLALITQWVLLTFIDQNFIDQENIEKVESALRKVPMIRQSYFQQIMTLAVITEYKTSRNHSPKNTMKLVAKLHQSCGVRFGPTTRIQFVHFQFQNCFSQIVDSSLFSLQTIKSYVQCFQELQLLQHFFLYLFYLVHKTSDQSQDLTSLQVLSNVLDIYEEKYYNGMFLWIYSFLSSKYFKKQGSNQQIIAVIKDKIKRLTDRTVNAYVADVNEAIKHDQQLRQTYYLVQNLYHVYPQGHPKINELYDALNKTKQQTTQTIQYYDSLRQIQITICFQEGRLQDGISVCKKEIWSILKTTEPRLRYSQSLDSYIGKMIIISCHFEQKERNQWLSHFYDFFKEYDLFDYLFSIRFGSNTLMALSAYVLLHSNDKAKIIQFELQLMDIIRQSPYKFFIRQHTKTLEYLWKVRYHRMGQQTNDILLQFFRQEKKNINPYSCIFLCFFITSVTDQALIMKMAVFLCKNVDYVSVDAKYCTLYCLFLHLLFQEDLVRRKRRRIMSYAYYVDIGKGANFQFFLMQLGLHRLRRQARNNQFKRLMMNKWKRFHRFMKVE